LDSRTSATSNCRSLSSVQRSKAQMRAKAIPGESALKRTLS
jgi:hypothetical protein